MGGEISQLLLFSICVVADPPVGEEYVLNPNAPPCALATLDISQPRIMKLGGTLVAAAVLSMAF